MFEAIFIKPWPGWVAGPLVGLYAVAFFLVMRRNLGASSSYPGVIEAVRGTDDPKHVDLTRPDDPLALPKPAREDAPRWRVWWLAGLLAAGALNWALGGEGTGSLDLPGFVETFVGLSLPARLGLLAFGGVLIGFGTRMSGGCTSGHAIFGISQRQLPSVYATCTFFAVGMATTFLIRSLMGGL